jgi:hypothetical protein
VDTAGLSALWSAAWGDCPPVSYAQARHGARGAPGARGAGVGRELLVLTASWSASAGPAAREAELAGAMPAASYWTSVLTDDSEPGATWTHLWASAARLHGKDLSRLLRLVADYVTGGVIITTAEMSWLYAPYDGGADVIAATAGHKDQLRRHHQDWLSPHPSGL